MDSTNLAVVVTEAPHAHDEALGLLCCAVAAVGFGSNYVPVKRVDCGDGFFYAFCMSLGVGLVGLAVNFSNLTTGEFFEGPEFHPIAMLGGAAAMLGALLTPTVIRLIGLGVGLSVWSLSNMFMSWATGYFGLFGIWKESIQCPWMNFAGLGLAAVSLILLIWAIEKPTPQQMQEQPSPSEQEVAPHGQDTAHGEHPIEDPELGLVGLPVDPLSREVERSAGLALAAESLVLREQGVAPHGQGESGSGSLLEDPELGSVRSTSDQLSSGGVFSENCKQVSEAVDDMTAKPNAMLPVLFARETPIDTTACPSSASERDDIGEGQTEVKGDMADLAERVNTRATLGSLDERCSQVIGVLLALVAGMLLGSTFDSSTVLLQMATAGDMRYSENTFDYVFSTYVGIVLTGVTSFATYLCVKRRQAFVRREIILPGIAAGMLGGIAQTARFKAYQELSIVVAFPIVTALPGMVAMLWGVLLFGELKTARARTFAALAMALRVPSVVLIAMSDIAP